MNEQTQPSHHLRNGNNDLHRKRPYSKAAVPIADIAARYTPGTVYEQEPDAQPVRTYRLTPLDEFRFGHLTTDDQRARLAYALERARAWMELRQQQAGLSFVITGPWGTGKTTIAENMMLPFQRSCGADRGDEAGYHALILAAIAKLKAGDPRREPLTTLLERPSTDDAPVNSQTILDGRLFKANELMRLMGDRTPLSSALGEARIVVIDDAGSENFRTDTYTPSEEQERNARHSHYGDFFDYVYHDRRVRPLHVVVTSNKPLMVNDQINDEFINIFGGRAFDRLYQMSSGFMCDLSGLPSYRPYMVRVK